MTSLDGDIEVSEVCCFYKKSRKLFSPQHKIMKIGRETFSPGMKYKACDLCHRNQTYERAEVVLSGCLGTHFPLKWRIRQI